MPRVFMLKGTAPIVNAEVESQGREGTIPGNLVNKGLPDADWLRFLSRMYESIGLSKDLQLYQDLELRLNMDTAVVAEPDLTTFVAASRVWQFDSSVVEELFFSAKLPLNYREETILEPYVEWAPSFPTTGNVVWSMDFALQAVGGVWAPSPTISVKSASTGVINKSIRALFPQISGVGRKKGDGFVCRLYRNATDGDDDYTGDSFMTHFGIRHRIDGVGWEEAHPVL